MGGKFSDAAIYRSGPARFDKLTEDSFSQALLRTEIFIHVLAVNYMFSVDTRRTRFVFKTLRRMLM